MLSAPHRVTDPVTFREVTRSGCRASSRTLVTHLAGPVGGQEAPTRVGFVVGKSVGNSVVRHRVQRRLRHLVRERLAALPASSRLVVRALPRAASASYVELGADLDACLERAGRALTGGGG